MVSESTMRALMTGLTEPAYVVSEKMTVTAFNAPGADFAPGLSSEGCSLAEVLGTEVCNEVVAPCLASGKITARQDCPLRSSNGKQTHALAYAMRLDDQAGVLLVIHDTSAVDAIREELDEQKTRVQEYHDSTMEIAIGLSELFEVLSEVRRGNLDARASEETLKNSNDLVAQMASTVNATVKELQEQLTLIQRQQYAIEELSTPILQVWDQILALPIVGIVDSRRAAMIMERLLVEIKERQARFVILDITGVEVVDTRTADLFIKVIRAAELLGANCIITGIGPAVAQTLVDLGVDLAGITTLRDLQDALRECFHRMSAKPARPAATERYG